MPSIQQISDELNKNLAISTLKINDISSGCGQSFDLIIVSKDFEDLNLLKRQRRVNTILKDLMTEIHALTMKTWTPKEWEEKQ